MAVLYLSGSIGLPVRGCRISGEAKRVLAGGFDFPSRPSIDRQALGSELRFFFLELGLLRFELDADNDANFDLLVGLSDVWGVLGLVAWTPQLARSEPNFSFLCADCCPRLHLRDFLMPRWLSVPDCELRAPSWLWYPLPMTPAEVYPGDVYPLPAAPSPGDETHPP